jgi:hypothetical protein
MGSMTHALSFCDSDDSARGWRKSSRSYGAGNCIEITPNGDRVEVRDSTDTQDAVLTLSSAQWNVFAEDGRNDCFETYAA